MSMLKNPKIRREKIKRTKGAHHKLAGIAAADAVAVHIKLN